MKRTLTLAVILLGLVASIGLSGCNQESSTSTTAPSTNAPAGTNAP